MVHLEAVLARRARPTDEVSCSQPGRGFSKKFAAVTPQGGWWAWINQQRIVAM